MRKLFAALVVLLAATTVRAQLTVEVTGAGANRIPIAVVPLAGEAALPQGVSGIVRADLERSGLFRSIEVPSQSPAMNEQSAVNFAEWRSRLADALVLGSVARQADGRFELRFKLFDTVKSADLGGVRFPDVGREQLREAAHRISDFIYEKLTGEKGVFGTRIAYVTKRGDVYELQIADYDGQNPEWILRSNEPIISPAWSPDGTRLAYVSFEQKKPIIYLHTLGSTQRRVLANFKGSNSAPAWAPDGSKLAVALSRDGGSQIYQINPDGTGLRRLTNTQGIDTEPRYSPDGQWIYFTSDRGGSPQIYRMPANGGDAQRVTFEGSYNVSPRVSPNGQQLAYITRNGGRFQVALLDFSSRQVQVITDSDRDESPSFAPNGRMILLATIVGGRGILSAVSSDGRVKQRLSGATGGDVREPAWGPMARRVN